MREEYRTARLDIEKLLNRYESNFAEPRKHTEKERTQLRTEIEPKWEQYQTMQLTLPIDDAPVRRLCQALTNNGYATFSSCDGHGKEIPHIFFRCRKPTLVAELSYILRQESAIKHLIWGIQAEYTTIFPTNRLSLFYSLEPQIVKKGKLLDPNKDYGKMIEDFDILGFCIHEHFSKQK